MLLELLTELTISVYSFNSFKKVYEKIYYSKYDRNHFVSGKIFTTGNKFTQPTTVTISISADD